MARSKEADRADPNDMRTNQINVIPSFFECDPLAREFPREWKDIWFRKYSRIDDDGVPKYECPLCKKLFDHSTISQLQGDHIWPYSMFGETSPANYQLLCGRCNAKKHDYINHKIRRTLGNGQFRSLIATYLQQMVSSGVLEEDAILEELLAEP
jgi:5-methylcytosine-specific restriction endonuclease McrA